MARGWSEGQKLVFIKIRITNYIVIFGDNYKHFCLPYPTNLRAMCSAFLAQACTDFRLFLFHQVTGKNIYICIYYKKYSSFITNLGNIFYKIFLENIYTSSGDIRNFLLQLGQCFRQYIKPDRKIYFFQNCSKEITLMGGRASLWSLAILHNSN